MSDLMQDLDAMFSDVEPTTSAPVAEAKVVEPTPSVTPQTVQQSVPQSAPVQQTVAPTIQTQQAAPMMVAPTQTQVATTSADDFTIDLPNELKNQMAEMGLEIGEIGVKVSSVPIEKYKASGSKIDRIGFITNKVIPIKFHYIEGVGSVLCFGGKCCEIDGNPQVRYMFPIVVYTTDAEGNLSGGNVQLKMLSAGADLYKTICTINNGSKAMGGIDHIDLLVTCTDEKYQKMTLVQAGEAIWRKYPQIIQFIRDKWTKDGANAYQAVARKVDEETLLRLMNIGGGDTSSANDTVQSQDLSKYFN